MTTVAGRPVGPDSVSGSIKGGTKSSIGSTAGFLGTGQPANRTGNDKHYAGTVGGALGPGANCLPMTGSASPMTSIEKPFKKGGV